MNNRMNPSHLPNSYHIDPFVNTDNRISTQNPSFTNSSNFTPNGFLCPTRKTHDGLGDIPLSQALSGLEYNPTSSNPEILYNSDSQSLLSPPDSTNGSHNGHLPSTTSTFDFVDATKTAASNASTVDHFSAIPQFSDINWNVPIMTELNQARPQLLHPHVSPQVAYGHPGAVVNPYGIPSTRSMDQYPNTHQYARPFNGPSIHNPVFNRITRSPPFNQLPVPLPTTFSVGNSYTQMSTQPSGRSEGPPFGETKIIHSLLTRQNQSVHPEISASIQKGFFQVDGKWTCYRRNYFTVACAFTFKNGVPDGPVYVEKHSHMNLIQQYSLSISAKTGNASNQESEIRQLVQHTPKRDKATETIPGRHVVQPAPIQSLQVNGILTGQPLYHASHHIPSSMVSPFDSYNSQNHSSTPNSFTFERIQFQKATANNGKRRAQQQFFHVVVELSVNIGGLNGPENWIIVATRQSDPMVVRGRSPGHYKDNIRRDGQTNMDPDRGTGAGGDGGHINLPMPTFMGNPPSSSMDWVPSHRQTNHYGNTYSTQQYGSDYSPQSLGSATTLTESSTEGDYELPEVLHPKFNTNYNSTHYVSNTSPYANNDRATVPDPFNYSRKRRFEEDTVESSRNFFRGGHPLPECLSPHAFDIAGTSGVKPVCASS